MRRHLRLSLAALTIVLVPLLVLTPRSVAAQHAKAAASDTAKRGGAKTPPPLPDPGVQVCQPGDPACPPPDVTFTPYGGSFGTPSQSITIDWCGHALLRSTSRQIVFNGVDVTGSFSYTTSAQAGCTQHATSSGTITLASGSNTLYAYIEDNSFQGGSNSASYALVGATISLAPQPQDRIDVSGCVADCFETTLAYAMPAYVSLGVPRSVSLLYRSGRARPFGRVELDASHASAPAGTRIALALTSPTGGNVTFANGIQTLYFQSAAGGTTRLAAEFEDATVSTGRHLYTATVTYLNANGTQFSAPVTANVGTIIVDDRTSPYGAGVEIVGLQRLYSQSNGVLITDGTGSATFFSGACNIMTACTYSTPAGDFSSLYTTGDGSYYRKYPDGTVVRLTGNGYHWTTTDRFGAATTYGYIWSSASNSYALQTAQDPRGASTVLAYRDGSNPSWKAGTLDWMSQGLGDGRVSYFAIDLNNDLRELVDADGEYFGKADYDAHRLTHFQDRNVKFWDYAYNNAKTARAQTITAPTVTTTTGSQRPATQLLEPAGAALRYAANGGGTFAAPVPNTTDLRGSVTDAGGHPMTFSADKWGQPLAITDALALTTTITRDANGLVTQVLHRTGAVDAFRYSGANLLMSRLAGQDSTNYRWNTSYALLDSTWGPRQPFQRFVYGTNGAIQTVIKRYSQSDPTSFTSQYTTDGYGRVLTVTDPASHVTRFFYNNALGNLDSTAMAAGQWTKTTYDGFGRASVQSALGRPASVTTEYDALNRVRKVYDGQHAQPFKYHYGAVFLDSITDPMGQTFRRTVNALGWKTSEPDVDPAKGSITFNYDVEGQVRSWTNRRGQTISLDYDPLHRVTSRVGATMADYFGYSSDDRRMAAWNAVSTDSLFFAVNGWKDSSVTRVAGQRFRQQFLPDVGQRLDSVDIAMTGGPIVFAARKYVYEAVKGTPTEIRLSGGAGGAGAKFNYDGEMFLSGIRYQMPLSQEATRQLYYTTTHQTYGDELNLGAYGSSSFSRYVGYDSLGRIRESMTDGAYPYKTFKFATAGQLGERARFSSRTAFCPTPNADFGLNCAPFFNPAAANEKDVYTYDDALNRRSDGNSGRTAGGTTWSSSTDLAYATGDRISTITPLGGTMGGFQLLPDPAYFATFERDLDGNVTRRYNAAGTDVRYAWDEQGRMTSVTVPSTGRTAAYDYNAFGQLVRRRTNGTTDRHFLWSGDDLLAELDGAATGRVAEYAYWSTDQPMAMVTGSQGIASFEYFLQDQLGNVRTTFRRATNAPIMFGSDYTEWGLLRDTLAVSSPNRLRWKGMIWEGDSTQLYYARNRWYSPQFGGFMSEDPLGPAGGPNTYAFADNDPINGSDPYGLMPGFVPGLPLPPGPYQYGYNDGFPRPNPKYPGPRPGVAPQFPTAASTGPTDFYYLGQAMEGLKREANSSTEAWRLSYEKSSGLNAIGPAVMGGAAALGTEPEATAIVLGAALGYEQRPFYRYVGPASNPNSPWLHRGWGWGPAYGRDFEAAAEALQMPNLPTDVIKVKVPWWQPVRGPRQATIFPNLGRGGGLEYIRGWFFPN